jgi:predicted ATP-grasp superfamily ATP-dependent carboligase
MDLFGDLDTRAACASFQVITAAERANSQLLAQRIAEFAAREQAMVVWVGGLQCAAGSGEFSRPTTRELASLAHEFGFRFPPTLAASTERNPPEPAEGRWLCKDNDSTGGLGVRFSVNENFRPLTPTAYLQRWIPGRPYGLVALAQPDQTSLIGLTRSIYRRCDDLPFVYAGSRTIEHDDAIPWQKMQNLCDQIVQQRGLRGLFNLDWIRDPHNQWWLLEINERPSASCEILERQRRYKQTVTHRDSLMRLHIDAVLRMSNRIASAQYPETELPETLPTQSHARAWTHLKRIVYSRHTGVVQIASLIAAWKTEHPDLMIADIPAENTLIETGQPIATIVVSSDESQARMAQVLRVAVKEVQATVISKR